MGNLNKRNIINEAERILQKCEEKYKEEGKSKKRLRELERKCKKLKRYNILWKIALSVVIISFMIVIM